LNGVVFWGAWEKADALPRFVPPPSGTALYDVRTSSKKAVLNLTARRDARPADLLVAADYFADQVNAPNSAWSGLVFDLSAWPLEKVAALLVGVPPP
jgi:hypothetical protein